MAGNPNWAGGKSGNPKGRPKKAASLTNILQEALEIKDVENDDGRLISRKQAICTRLIELAVAGDLPAIKYIYDRIDGQPIATQELTGRDGESLIPDKIQIEFVKP
ncbi:MAG: hypothetical protein C0436_00320 [Alphaproteobacteria bacterium]|nr:hypothetical protein [Alphaproteobacteria bacterium]